MVVTVQEPQKFSDAQRMELRSYVELAGEAISQYWPMRTFIHHNPLHGLESLPFDQAVRRGAQLFGGKEYLDNETFRGYVKSGRICEEDLRAALEPLAVDKAVPLAGRSMLHLDVLCADMIHGITEPRAHGTPAIDNDDADARSRIASWLRKIEGIQDMISRTPLTSWPTLHWASRETLGTWCDRTLGTAIVETINREMVKWCSVFLDEGEAGWSMPHRHETFYRAWKSLAQHDWTLGLIGVREAAKKICALPDRPEDAVLDSLTRLTIPKWAWEEYLSLHLAAMPGWAGYIKWRAHQSGYPWQQHFPIDLVKYLAVRLFYEVELGAEACRDHLDIGGNYDEIRADMDQHPHAHWVRREWVAERLSKPAAEQMRRLSNSDQGGNSVAWEELGRQQYGVRLDQDTGDYVDSASQSLLRLTRVFSVDPAALESTSASDVRTLLHWLVGFPASQQGPRWLEAFEASHRRQALNDLRVVAARMSSVDHESQSRPLAQIVFCIDVRSEVFRRHIEHRGGYETLGLAGFFGVPLDYQPFSARHTVTHCPVLLKPKNQVREVPRSYHGALAQRHKSAIRFSEAVHTLLHDLKENVITPYVMVEALGWFFGLPLLGKTLFPRWYDKASRWLKQSLMPRVATTLTVDKITREHAEEMIAAEQHALIRELVRERFALRGAALSPALLEQIRKKAIGHADGINGGLAEAFNCPPEAEEALYQELRERYRISPRGISERLERITQTGFSVTEQTYFVEAALRLMGLTSNFARVVVFCAHGSTSQNNPYESALDCGACGGNQGLPNARIIAAMANKPAVRALLLARGIAIPADTQFLAAQHDTTTDGVHIVDLEDVPATHRKDLTRLIADLEEAGIQAALERGLALGVPSEPIEHKAARQLAWRRSEDWAETRPEWGLSGNNLMIIGRRALTQTVDLHGRAFLHSYDYLQDTSGRLLETIMTAPLVVAQWINMEHYFSTVDNEVYGSGSKVYHNVVGRIGVMTGSWSDLRIGLPAQTVLNGRTPYHDPLRLLTIIEAPPDRVRAIIDRHSLLRQLFHQGWVGLAVLDPRDRLFYHFDRTAGWRGGGQDNDRLNVASDEGNQDRSSG